MTVSKFKTIPPRVIIFAGPNGAGKSTHADAILAALGIQTFVNADYVARGLSGRNAEAVAMMAGRIMLTRLKELAAAKQDFAFESTLSSRSFALTESAGLSGSHLLFLTGQRVAGQCAELSCAWRWVGTMC